MRPAATRPSRTIADCHFSLGFLPDLGIGAERIQPRTRTTTMQATNTGKELTTAELSKRYVGVHQKYAGKYDYY